MRDGARLYIERGVEPGDFLCAVLCDSLTQAFGRADHINQLYMHNWASWLYSNCPPQAWGDRDTIEKWIAHSGLEGLRDTIAKGESE